MSACELFLDEHTSLECDKDPKHTEALKRRADCGQPWSPIVVGRDGGGRRDFLDGEPIHCGTGLELQAFEIRSDDYGEWRVWLQRGERVRYELAWRTAVDVLAGAERVGMLHAGVAGYEFTKRIHDQMRFRWPRVPR